MKDIIERKENVWSYLKQVDKTPKNGEKNEMCEEDVTEKRKKD